jgi:serine/threonine protein kinase
MSNVISEGEGFMSVTEQVEQLPELGALTSRRIGDYVLCERLVGGGLTEVYRALEQPSGRAVAIKTVSVARPGGSEVYARFRLEAKRLATVRHKHIVPLYASGEIDDLLYFAMPLLPGSLRDRLEEDRRVPPVEAVRLALQIASALSAAHARGIVHRDVKPENILIDADGDALLTDFGIARELAALQLDDVTWTLSSIGLPVGTPEYMPPEQLRGEPADQRVDVYALGAVLYEMLTGQAPHEGATPWAVAAQTLMKEITPPSGYTLDIWPALERLVMSALARQPQDRPADMLAFEEILRDALGVMEERWESYCVGELAWVKPTDEADPIRRTGERGASAPLAPSASKSGRNSEGASHSSRGASAGALSQPWKVVCHILVRTVSDFATSAALSWRLTTPTYQARATSLRRMLQRHSRSALKRSIKIGLLVVQSQREPMRHRSAVDVMRISALPWLFTSTKKSALSKDAQRLHVDPGQWLLFSAHGSWKARASALRSRAAPSLNLTACLGQMFICRCCKYR